MLVLGGLLLPVVAILYALPIGAAWLALIATVVLGAIGFAAVGTAYAALTVRMRAREVMLPLLMLPRSLAFLNRSNLCLPRRRSVLISPSRPST